MKTYCGYIRVSTAKQGEFGVSLEAQRDAILRHAQRNSLHLQIWFEERETAAKRGRPVFAQMLKMLRRGKLDGVIIHKIDRSARNLKDWADLGELIDQGIEVHFANEGLDLHSRGGRLSADIQAVVAADYVRNLREETRKGFYGRIRQGFFPLPAPLGYLDNGKARHKTFDPERAHLIRQAFELYGESRHSLDSLGEELHRLGLRNRNGNRVTRNGLSVLLNNPFYIGLIRLRRTAETFPGAHQPLISKTLFDRVQAVLAGKTSTRVQRHAFAFRRLLRCSRCQYSLIGETQKGHIYYRCHTRSCPRTAVREEAVEERFLDVLRPLQLSPEEVSFCRQKVSELRHNWAQQRDDELRANVLAAGKLQERLGRLTDAFLDGAIDKHLFEERKTALLMDRRRLDEQKRELEGGVKTLPDRLEEFLELARMANFNYKMRLPEEKRDLITIVTSNRAVRAKTLDISLSPPFDAVAKRWKGSNCGPRQDMPRTWDRLIPILLKWLVRNPDHAAPVDLQGSDRIATESKGWKHGSNGKFLPVKKG